MRISIEGLIGSGKSTVSKSLNPQFTVYEENIPGWTPWLEKTQLDPHRWAFTMQTKILLDLCSTPKNTIVERSPLTAKSVFTKRLHDQEFITNEEYQLYLEMYNQFSWKPDIIIYIDTPPAICLQRIKERNRNCECRITLHDLEDLEHYHELAFQSMPSIPLWRVDGTQNPEEVVNQVKKILKFVAIPLMNSQPYDKPCQAVFSI